MARRGRRGVNTGDGSDGSSDDRCDGFRKVAALPSSTASGSSDAATSHYDTVAVESVTPGDVLIVLPGETVPVDGELLSGSATLDLSNINGEPVPRGVFAGARVSRRGERLDHADHACHRSRPRLAIPAHPRARRGRAEFPPGGGEDRRCAGSAVHGARTGDRGRGMVGVRCADALRSGAGAGDSLPVADRRPRRVCGGNRAD